MPACPPYPASLPVDSPVAPGLAPSLVLVGAGPRGTGLVERLAANAPRLFAGGRLDLHLVDPYPPGGGRIWRSDQSPLLWMNSLAEDVTMYTDASVEREGPVVPGPSLAEWAAGIRDGAEHAPLDAETAAEARGLTGQSFASRRLQSAYLGWVYERSVAALPPGITVHEHRRRAVRVSGPRGGRQRVWLEGQAEPLVADLVVLALGHLTAEPDAEESTLAAFAATRGLTYLPPEFTADSDLRGLRPGEPVIVRGFGLAFFDLMVLLTEGRGGRYTTDAEGTVTYHPSGREPVLHVGSRRGVPYRSKIGYTWRGERPPLPRFLGPAEVEELRPRPGPLDFHRDLWPLIDKELGFAHYHRLFTAHPERTGVDWPEFEKRYADLDAGSAELRALVASCVPDPADRLDLTALDHPLDGVRFPGADSLQDGLRAHIEADLARRHDPRHSPDLAVFLGLLSVYGQLVRLGDTGPRWHGFFSYLASGPPGPRLRQLLALSRAGVVRFLGADTRVETDAVRGLFRARGASAPGPGVEAAALVEARLPAPTVARSRDPLLRGLYGESAVTPAGLLAVDPGDARILGRDGRPHPRRFALGPHTDARASGAFARPRSNAPAFRQNDALARAALTFLRGLSCRGVPSAGA
ncbi:FAD/NAD(P)-binding protein [Streptomyces netropsis]|uniref:Putative NAD(P)/FAD-binding protein YdhS n=1 Tax=Streptomyces netropsis TaxID=55404 RepID=A0A7W7LAL3_STRNE|nr:FAD/NAD(P)-binding domain-containing protein [Streptomyces netropsis]MBB4886647.1 putative NAD(P)/FAD-binding protein YdhS [Streptomyces netropsis]GGR21619.1 adenylate cyclase [Streptomyces netropsis]